MKLISVFISFLIVVSVKICFANETASAAEEKKVLNLFNSINGDKEGLSFDVFQKGVIGYYNLKKQTKIKKNLITLIDFRLPSNKKRLWVIDLDSNKVMYNTLVAHGQMTGDLYATSFSNLPDSHKSSLGFYVTQQRYNGKHKLSLKLQGVEPYFNENALKRSIVIHGAEYVSENWIKRYGRLGRSHGCPAIPVEICEELISKIENGSCLFIFYPNSQYEKDSVLIKPQGGKAIL